MPVLEFDIGVGISVLFYGKTYIMLTKEEPSGKTVDWLFLLCTLNVM
jgi:hypothetical protein